MTPIVLAAVAALVWGTSDFCGGKSSQRASALAVTVISQLASLPVLVLGLLLIPGTPRLTDLGWGALAGFAGLAGVVLLYRGLATGAMVIVSPVTAVTAAVVPLVAGLLLDGALGQLALLGAGCAILAIALISAVPGAGPRPAMGGLLGLALTSGSMFGIFFILLSQAHPESGLWALAGVRFTSMLLGLSLVARSGTGLRMTRPALIWAAFAGALDLAANGLFLLAVMQGHLSVVAVLASLYPASTVLLALGVDRERLRGTQVAGLTFAVAALALVAV